METQALNMLKTPRDITTKPEILDNFKALASKVMARKEKSQQGYHNQTRNSASRSGACY
jgi:hypothetical protein